MACWGGNFFGLSGGGDWNYTDTGYPRPVSAPGLYDRGSTIAAGNESICELLIDGRVQCAGNSYNGVVTGLSGSATAIAAGSSHTCALLVTGGAQCWGSNGSGQLGDGTTKTRDKPVTVKGLSGSVSAIAAGNEHTCALLNGGSVQCWGNNAGGQLGDGTTTNRLTPVTVQGLSGTVSAITAGSSHTCALLVTGGAQCWGNNGSGQLGDGTTADQALPVAVSGLSENVSTIAAGYSHTCVVLISGGVQCWGNNDSGQLGDGTTTNRTTPVSVSGLSSPVGALALGGSHTCALLNNGGVQCWGWNGWGQLGDGTAWRTLPVDVAAGNTAPPVPTPTPQNSDFEPNDTCEQAAPINVGTAYSSTLVSSTDVDYFKVEIKQPNTLLTIRLNHPDQDYDLTLQLGCPADGGRAPPVGRARHVGEELITIPIGPQTGTYVVKVEGYDGAASATPYTLQVTVQPQPTNTVQTLILVNQARLAKLYGATETERLINRLNEFASHPAVHGILFHLEDDELTTSFYQEWDDTPVANPLANVEAANHVAERIKGLISQYLATYSGRRYVVLVGDDRIIPYYRQAITPLRTAQSLYWQPESLYPLVDFTQHPLGAALNQDRTLTDDFYADFTPLRWPAHELYVPDLAIGRLVETPTEMLASINAFLSTNGEVTAQSALVTGYDFGLDSGQDRCALLKAAGINSDCTLVGPGWSAAQLSNAWLNQRHDLASLFNHANHHAFFAADRSELPADVNGTANLSGTLVYVIGCQAGLNLPPDNGAYPSYDWPQRFVGQGATYIASTGWAYGVAGNIGYMEELMHLLTVKLTDPNGITIGDALRHAKLDYTVTRPASGSYRAQLDALDAKTLASTVLYGLPMLRLRTTGSTAQQAQASTLPPIAPSDLRIVSNPATVSASATKWQVDNTVPPGLVIKQIQKEGPYLHERHDNPFGSYFSAGEVRVRTNFPLQPITNEHFVDQLGEPRGVLFERGEYQDLPNFNPVIAAATDTNSSPTPTEPAYTEGGWYPDIPVTLNRVRFLDGTVDAWEVSRLTGQYLQRSQTERLYTYLGYTLYYYRSPTPDGIGGSLPPDLDPPLIQAVTPISLSTGVQVTATVADASGLYRVVATWTTGQGQWQSTDLALDASSDTWVGMIPSQASSVTFLLQAVDNAGNVAADTNQGLYYSTQPHPGAQLYLPVIRR